MDELSNPQVIIGERIAGREASVRRELKQISRNLTEQTFDLIELLTEGVKNNYFPEGLGDFSEKELSIKRRKAEYLVRIGTVCAAVGVARTTYEKVGVSKLREITRLDPAGSWFNPETKQNEPLAECIANLLVDAVEMTAEAVEELVAKYLGQTEGNAMVHRSYKVTKSAWENVIQPAYELVRRKLGSAKRDEDGKAVDYPDGVCAEMIAAEYLADPNNALFVEVENYVTATPVEGVTVGTTLLQEVPNESDTTVV